MVTRAYVLRSRFWPAIVSLILITPFDLPAQTPPRIDLAPPDATLEHGFTAIRSVRELSDGRLLVSDRTERQVYAVDWASGAVQPVGRMGEGPGEYRSNGWLHPLGNDSTILTDMDLRRWLVLDGTSVVETLPASHPASELFGPDFQGTDASGRVLGQKAYKWTPSVAVPMGTMQADSVMLLLAETALMQCYDTENQSASPDGTSSADVCQHVPSLHVPEPERESSIQQLPPLPDSIAAAMLPLLDKVVRYVMLERDSIPEIARPTAKGMLRRTGGDVALLLTYRPVPRASSYDYSRIEPRLTDVARSVVAGASLGSVRVRPGRVVPVQFDGVRMTGYDIVSDQDEVLATCRQRMLIPPPPLPGNRPRQLISECDLFDGVGIILRLSYPMPISDSTYMVSVDIKTGARGLESIPVHFAVHVELVNGRWSVVRVLRDDIFIS